MHTRALPCCCSDPEFIGSEVKDEALFSVAWNRHQLCRAVYCGIAISYLSYFPKIKIRTTPFMRASARELLVPFYTPLVWCGRGFEPTTSHSESGRSTNCAIGVFVGTMLKTYAAISNRLETGKVVWVLSFDH